jgi:hypothetical protein
MRVTTARIAHVLGLLAWVVVQAQRTRVEAAQDEPVVVYAARKIITMDPGRPVAAAVSRRVSPSSGRV